MQTAAGLGYLQVFLRILFARVIFKVPVWRQIRIFQFNVSNSSSMCQCVNYASVYSVFNVSMCKFHWHLNVSMFNPSINVSCVNVSMSQCVDVSMCQCVKLSMRRGPMFNVQCVKVSMRRVSTCQCVNVLCVNASTRQCVNVQT